MKVMKSEIKCCATHEKRVSKMGNVEVSKKILRRRIDLS